MFLRQSRLLSTTLARGIQAWLELYVLPTIEWHIFDLRCQMLALLVPYIVVVVVLVTGDKRAATRRLRRVAPLLSYVTPQRIALGSYLFQCYSSQDGSNLALVALWW